MNAKIDFKSALLGLAAGIIATFGMAAATDSPYEAGRYRLETAPNYALVIDTQTGRVWSTGYPTTSSYRNDGDFYEPKLRR